jgi:hypothetical protein
MNPGDSGTSSPEHLSLAQDRGRRQVVSLVLGVYVLLILEGALRKWVLTSYGQELYFVRDPLVVAIYWLALRHSLFPRANPLLLVGVAFGVLGLLLIGLQAVGVASTIEKWPLLAAYGWRNYFLYIPLPFVIGEVFKEADLRRLMKITLLLSIPVAVLVLMQFRSPPTAPINVGFSANEAQQFRGLTVDSEHTRPMGLFTSDVGEKEFVVSSVAMLLALWIAPRARRFLRRWQLLVATCAILTCLALSGSRGAVVHSGLILLATVASAAILRGAGASARAVLLPLALAVIAVALYPVVFPEGYSTFINRWQLAAANETQFSGLGILGRALYGFVDFFDLMGSTPLSGYGLGLAGNASITLGVTIPGFQGWAETDWARHIVDLGPIVGLAFIAYRIWLVAWLARICLAGVRASGDALPLLWCAFAGVDLLYGQVTGHGTVNGYVWLFTGLSLAAARAHVAAGTVREQHTADDARIFPNLMR